MPWMYLIIAGCFEVIGIIGIKKTAEKDNFMNNVILIGGFLISFAFLLEAMKTIPLSTAYAVWTGIGTVGGAIVGMLLFKEPRNLLRMLFIFGIIGAVVALKLLG
ncbi:multidrug efflux SMR transporter [Paenibacillus sp. SC116]|uniref:DMT family transporter n=1 Tax=Paenibacillus sp. SC116 TaxID=2968986 RepID=UPI00215A1979|nr:multidrug efflux SMR transporter [Paenibacillus sp. SC116]MCR8842717.1 multidrug efflux SMR transporter [Paenibacillus sp. SC116]